MPYLVLKTSVISCLKDKFISIYHDYLFVKLYLFIFISQLTWKLYLFKTNSFALMLIANITLSS